MTSRRCRGNHRVDAPQYIKQREPAGAQKKNSCQFILTVPLFYVARRPRPASSLRTIVSKPVALKQREPAGAQKKNSCQFILTVPLFYVARRPRPASSLRTIVSKPVAPFWVVVGIRLSSGHSSAQFAPCRSRANPLSGAASGNDLSKYADRARGTNP